MADPNDLQAVRARLGTYFNKTESIRDQSLFAAMCLALPYADDGRVSTIDVMVSGDEITVTDDGPGISLGDMRGTTMPIAEHLMCVIGSCAEHKNNGQGEMLCGVSLAAVNAISTSASFVTMIDGTAFAQKYTLGASTAPFKKVDRSSPGTRLRFSLDKRWAGRQGFDLSSVENQVRRLGLDLSGTTINFSAS